MVLRTTIVLASRRVPAIQFRYGANSIVSAGSSNAVSASSATVGYKAFSATSEPIEDWQLPARYRRKAFDQKEIEYINRGGPE